MAFCPNCGSSVDHGSRFCDNCGNPLSPQARPSGSSARTPYASPYNSSAPANQNKLVMILTLAAAGCAGTAFLASLLSFLFVDRIREAGIILLVLSILSIAGAIPTAFFSMKNYLFRIITTACAGFASTCTLLVLFIEDDGPAFIVFFLFCIHAAAAAAVTLFLKDGVAARKTPRSF